MKKLMLLSLIMSQLIPLSAMKMAKHADYLAPTYNRADWSTIETSITIAPPDSRLEWEHVVTHNDVYTEKKAEQFNTELNKRITELLAQQLQKTICQGRGLTMLSFIQQADLDYYALLKFAKKRKSKPLLYFLLRHIEPVSIAYKWAVEKKNVENLKIVLPRNIDINSRIESTVPFTPLEYWITHATHLSYIQALLALNPDTNTQDLYGMTPLMHAVQLAKSTIVPLLLRYGANPHIQNDSGATALTYAATSPLIHSLLKAGIDNYYCVKCAKRGTAHITLRRFSNKVVHFICADCFETLQTKSTLCTADSNQRCHNNNQ